MWIFRNDSKNVTRKILQLFPVLFWMHVYMIFKGFTAPEIILKQIPYIIQLINSAMTVCLPNLKAKLCEPTWDQNHISILDFISNIHENTVTQHYMYNKN